MPGVADVADKRRGADVDPRRPTSSLARENHLSPEACLGSQRHQGKATDKGEEHKLD